MGHWIETVVRINENDGHYRWELLSVDDEMLTFRYAEPENGKWVVKQEVELTMDVARALFKPGVLPIAKDID